VLDGDTKVTDLSIYFSSENPTTTKQATFGVRGPFGSSCSVSSTQGVALLSIAGNLYGPYNTLIDQTFDVRADSIQLTDLGIYVGSEYCCGLGAWAGTVVIVTSSIITE
jgi:hypothetical protein